MLFCWYFSSFILILSSFIISSISFLKLPWTSFTYESSKFTQELFTGKSTMPNYGQGDYSCINSISCHQGDNDLCELSTSLLLARQILLPFELIFIVFQFFIIERLILVLFRKPIGNSNFFLIIIWLCPIVKTVGILVFLLVANVSVDYNTTQDKVVKAEIGITLSFVCLGLSALGTIVLLIFKVHKNEQVRMPDDDLDVSKYLNSGLLLIMSFLFLILANIYPFGTFEEFDIVKIGLTSIKEIDGYSDNLSFECIAEQECQISDDTCRIYKALKSTRESSVFLESFCYLFGLMWLENYIIVITKTQYINKISLMCCPVLYFVLTFSNLLHFCLKGHVKITSECNISNFNTDWQICSDLGLIFFIVSLVFCFLALISFEFTILLYGKKKEAEAETQANLAMGTFDIKKVQNISTNQMDNSGIFTYNPNIIADQTISTLEASPNKIHLKQDQKLGHR